jgi:hypothetical protein
LLLAHPPGEASASKLLAASLTKSTSFTPIQLFPFTLLGEVLPATVSIAAKFQRPTA